MTIYLKNKKPILICIGFLFYFFKGNAQDILNATKYFEANDFARAKASIDSITSFNENNDVQAWLLKAKIYNSINNSTTLKDLVVDAKQDAFYALKKAEQINYNYVEEQLKIEKYNLPLELYNGYTNDGLLYYNAGVENKSKDLFKEAQNNFKKAAEIGKHIYANKWGLYQFDTLNIFYNAKAAISANNDFDALYYSKLLINNNISFINKYNNCETIYQWLVYYYKINNEADNFNKYIDIATLIYPSSNYFILLHIDWLRQQNDFNKMFELYMDLFKNKPANLQYQMSYYNDIFNYLYLNDTSINLKNKMYYQQKLTSGLFEIINKNNANFNARLLLAKHFRNYAIETQKKISTCLNKNAIGCKNWQKEYIDMYNKSNVQLKFIVDTMNLKKENYNVFSQAFQLLILNFTQLKMQDQINFYQLKYK